MPNINVVRDKLINFEVFIAGGRKLGMADVQLPAIEYKTATLSGAGVGGEIEMPTPGQTGSMELEINWRTINDDNAALLAMKAHDLEIRGVNENYDAGTGELIAEAIKVNVRTLPKKGELGSLKPAEHTDTKSTLEIIYLKESINDKRVVEIDKLAYIHFVNGVDYMESIRKGLGL